MGLNREQAIDILERFDFFQGQRAGRELWNDKPYDVQEQDIAAFSRDVALLIDYIKELTEENEKLKYTSLTSITMEQALTRIRKLEKEKVETVHKTIAAVKIKCQRVSYADMTVPGVTHEIFTIKGKDLDEIIKEIGGEK